MDFAVIVVLLMAAAGIGLIIYMLKTPAKQDSSRGGIIMFPEEDKLKLDSEISALKDEREKLKSECENFKNELQETKKEDSDLRDQVSRLKEWYAKNQEALAKAQKENLDLKDKLTHQEKGITEQVSFTGNLNKELKEAKEKLEYLEKENKDLTEKIKAFTEGASTNKKQPQTPVQPPTLPQEKNKADETKKPRDEKEQEPPSK